MLQSIPWGNHQHPQRNIVLMGFHCSGKTSVGRLLARRMRRHFVDWDEELAQRSISPWQAIWPLAGERRAEREHVEARLVHDLGYRRETVIGMGAEACAVEEYMRELRDFAMLVFLDSPLAVILERAGLCSCLPRGSHLEEGRLDELFTSLKPSYERCDLHLHNGRMSPERAASLILHCFYG